MKNEYAYFASQLEKRTFEAFSKRGWDCNLTPHYINISESQRFAPDITLTKDDHIYGFVECVSVRPEQAANGMMISKRKQNQILYIIEKIKPELFIITEGRNYEVYFNGGYYGTMTIPLGYHEFELMKRENNSSGGQGGNGNDTLGLIARTVDKEQEATQEEKVLLDQQVCMAFDETDKKLKSLNDELVRIKEAYSRSQKEKAEQDAIIQMHIEKLTEQEETIAERDKTIAEQEEAIAKRDKIIAEQEETIAKRDETINEQEEIIRALYEQIDKQMEELSVYDMEGSITTCRVVYDGFWNKLDNHSQKYLAMAQYLYNIFISMDDQDFSPSVLEFGRAAENELLCKIYSGFIIRLSDRTERMSGNVSRYGDLKKAVKNYLENNGEYYIPARKMVEYLTFLPEQEEGDTYNNALKRYLRDQNINKVPLSESSFTDSADVLFDKYRNKAAHPGEAMKEEEASSCNEKTKEVLNIFMSAIQVQ